MGYAVYDDLTGLDRFAGYGVSAYCDFPGCDVKIDRGMGYRCEMYWDYEYDEDTEDEVEVALEGCGLHFCEKHLFHTTHGDVEWDGREHLEWLRWQLYARSWAEWREQNPKKVENIISILNGGCAPEQERILLIAAREEEGILLYDGNTMCGTAEALGPLDEWVSRGWIIAELHFPPFGDPRTDELIKLIREQCDELADENRPS